MTPSTVLTKKKGVEQDRVKDVLADISENVELFAPEISDQVTAYRRQRDTLLYTLNCVLLALAEDVGSTLVTFDAELLDHGAVAPSTVSEA
jgi:predicted nucleic acid-binding protein